MIAARASTIADVAKPIVKAAVDALGMSRGYRVAAFVASWEVARQDIGKPSGGMSVAEFAAWWRQPQSTAFRDLAWFREAFPGHEYPDRLLNEFADDRASRRRRPRGRGKLAGAGV